MSGIHTSVHIPDGVIGKTDSKKVFTKNWQSNQALITVFKQTYDVSVRQGNTTAMIRDDIDCSSGSCLIDNLTASLIVKFPNLTSVHTSVKMPDNIEGQASGEQFTNKNWQKDQAILTVFKQKFDIKIRKGSVSKIIDDVDCTTGNCLVENIISTLTIDFPGLSSVHSSAHVPDSIDNEAKGKIASNSNWKQNQTSITLLREIYDVKVNHGIKSIFPKRRKVDSPRVDWHRNPCLAASGDGLHRILPTVQQPADPIPDHRRR